MVKNPPTSAGDARDTGLIPRLGRSPGEGNGNPLQYSYRGNAKERSLAGYMGVTRNPTQLSTCLLKAFHSYNKDTRNLMTQANQNWIQKLL